MSAQRQRLSATRPLNGAAIAPTTVTQNVFTIPFTLNYEIDLFGRVRKSLEAANAALQASAADLENVRLLITSELAADYFQLRELDAEIAVVQRAIDFEQQGLSLVDKRHQGGAVSGLDVAQQQTVLDSSYTQLALLQQQRAQFQHAVATLQGIPASNSQHLCAPWTLFPPPCRWATVGTFATPSGHRNCRTTSCIRKCADRRSEICLLSEHQSGERWNSEYRHHATSEWTERYLVAGVGRIGATDCGRPTPCPIGTRASRLRRKCRQLSRSHLVAFQQVEDALSGLSALASASSSQERAVEDAGRSLTLANARYTGGLVTYLDVITAQEQVLNNERLAAQIQGQRLVMSVLLVKALGGGWDESSLSAIGVKPSLKQAVQQ